MATSSDGWKFHKNADGVEYWYHPITHQVQQHKPGAEQPDGEPLKCARCGGLGWHEDIQPNRNTGDAEQVQVQCYECRATGYRLMMRESDVDAKRYQFLRSRDLATLERGGIFAGMTPNNIVLNQEDLDAAIDAAMTTKIKGDES